MTGIQRNLQSALKKVFLKKKDVYFLLMQMVSLGIPNVTPNVSK